MNRENKRRTFEKGYYKTHPCHDSFTCRVCGRLVVPEAAGSGHRNHCPNCLSSLHVDEEPGDRTSDCGGVMDPIGVWVRRGGEWAVIHRCRRCGKLSSNRTAADDNPMKLMSVALRPLAEPPFPLEHIQKLTDLMGGSGSMEGYVWLVFVQERLWSSQALLISFPALGPPPGPFSAIGAAISRPFPGRPVSGPYAHYGIGSFYP